MFLMISYNQILNLENVWRTKPRQRRGNLLDLLEGDAIRLQIFGGFHLRPRHLGYLHIPLHLHLRRCSDLDSGLLSDLATTDILLGRPQYH